MPATRLLTGSRGHLAEAGVGYFAHLGRAGRIGLTLMAAGGAALLHGLVPSLFTTRASRTIVKLHDEVAGHAAPAPSLNLEGSADRMWLEFEI